MIKHGCAARRDRKPTVEYTAWALMIQRCYNSKRDGYSYYGGRGIAVCARWRDSFESFLADMGPKPPSAHSLDRFPNSDGNYEPDNCRWATKQEQMLNRRPLPYRSLVGQTFGRWTVLEVAAKNPTYRMRRYLCVCSCGTKRIVYGNCLKSGHSRSCGCIQRGYARRSAA